MKSCSVFVLCVLIVTCFLLTDVDGRKSRGSSRGSGKTSRGSGGRKVPQPSSGTDINVNAPKKPSAPDGWTIKKDNTIKKDVSTNVKSSPVNSASNPSYPASSGLSGTGAAGAGAAGAGGAAHAYPQSNGLSGAAQPSYPAGSGLSGSSPVKAAPPGYSQNAHPPAYSQNAPPAYNAPPPYSANGYNQPMGGYHGPPPAYGAGQGYGAPGYVNNPLGGPPMSYGNTFPSRGMAGGMGGYGGGFGGGGFGGGMMGYNKYGKSTSFLGNNKLAVILTGLTMWNLMRSGRSHNTYNYYNHGPDGKEQEPDPETEAILRELSNCTLTLTSLNDTDVLLIPCAMATSFAPNAKLDGKSDIPAYIPEADSPLNCTITVFTNNGLEIKTNILCDQLSSMAPKDSVPSPDSNPVPPVDGTNYNPNCIGGVDSISGAPCVNNAQLIPQYPPNPSGDGTNNPNCIGGVDRISGAPCVDGAQQFPPNPLIPPVDGTYNNPNCIGGVESISGAPCVNNAQQIPQYPLIPPVLLPVDQPILLDPVVVSSSTLEPPSSSSTPKLIESTSQATSSSTIDLMTE